MPVSPFAGVSTPSPRISRHSIVVVVTQSLSSRALGPIPHPQSGVTLTSWRPCRRHALVTIVAPPPCSANTSQRKGGSASRHPQLTCWQLPGLLRGSAGSVEISVVGTGPGAGPRGRSGRGKGRAWRARGQVRLRVLALVEGRGLPSAAARAQAMCQIDLQVGCTVQEPPGDEVAIVL